MLDINWNVQAISGLDVSALAASEKIADGSSEHDRPARLAFQEGLGGKYVNIADSMQLTPNVSIADGPAFPVVPSGRTTDYESGLLRPTSYTGEGNGVDLARDMVDLMQVERAYSANLAAIGSIDRSTGNILDMIA